MSLMMIDDDEDDAKRHWKSDNGFTTPRQWSLMTPPITQTPQDPQEAYGKRFTANLTSYIIWEHFST